MCAKITIQIYTEHLRQRFVAPTMQSTFILRTRMRTNEFAYNFRASLYNIYLLPRVCLLPIKIIIYFEFFIYTEISS